MMAELSPAQRQLILRIEEGETITREVFRWEHESFRLNGEYCPKTATVQALVRHGILVWDANGNGSIDQKALDAFLYPPPEKEEEADPMMDNMDKLGKELKSLDAALTIQQLEKRIKKLEEMIQLAKGRL